MERDAVLAALEELSDDQGAPLPRPLDEYLRCVARTGDPLLPWATVKPLFQRKLALVLDDFIQSPECRTSDAFDAGAMRTRLLLRLDSFDTCPFTVQRLSELLTTPRSEYNRTDKFMRAIEKNVLVVSGNDPPQDTNGVAEEEGATDSIHNGLEPPEPKRPRTDEDLEEMPAEEMPVKEQKQNGIHSDENKDITDVESTEPADLKVEQPKAEEPAKPEEETPNPPEPEKQVIQEPEPPVPEAPEVPATEPEKEETQAEDQEMPLEEKEAPLASPEKDLPEEEKIVSDEPVVEKPVLQEREEVPMEQQS